MIVLSGFTVPGLEELGKIWLKQGRSAILGVDRDLLLTSFSLHMQVKTPFILASQSPRRAQLLREAGVDFEQRNPPYADPDQPPGDLRGHQAGGYAKGLAERKAQSLSDLAVPAMVIAADTICVDDAGRLIGKPRDAAHAFEMVRSFVESEHRVITGVALLEAGQGKPVMRSFADVATVRFGSVSDTELQAYVATGDWSGKAGGYNLFDRRAAGWPIEVVGDPTTVVGLPMRRLMPLLRSR